MVASRRRLAAAFNRFCAPASLVLNAGSSFRFFFKRAASFSLRRFFLDGAYEADLNTSNPLGANGELAQAFAALLKLMWNDRAPVVSPRNFKHVLGRFAPQFAGYGQQDSQELCNYVLDKVCAHACHARA